MASFVEKLTEKSGFAVMISSSASTFCQRCFARRNDVNLEKSIASSAASFCSLLSLAHRCLYFPPAFIVPVYLCQSG
jgi:hypothetical protein